MSGGALDYAYEHISNTASIVMTRARTPLERAFANHLHRISEALQALEWSLSADTAKDAADIQMRGCLRKGDVLRQLMADAKGISRELEAEIHRLEGDADASE